MDLDCGRGKKPWRIFGGGAHGEIFGLVAGQGGRRGIVLDLFMILPILLILIGRHHTYRVRNIIATNAVNQKTLWRELC